MIPGNPALTRLVIGSLAMLLLGAAVYLGLGWVVRARGNWVRATAGQRVFDSFYAAYDRAAASLQPADRDGDGVCDGREWFRGSDPHRSSSYPLLSVVRDTDGFLVESARNYTWTSTPIRLVRDNILCFQIDERIAWRGHVQLTNECVSFPAGFQVTITAPAHTVIGPPGGPLGTAALTVPVATDGAFAFDIRASHGSPTSGAAPGNPWVLIDNAGTGDSIGSFAVKVFNPRLSAVIPAATRGVVRQHVPNFSPGLTGTDPSYLLEWPAQQNVDSFLVECARDVPGAEWFPVDHARGTDTACTLVQPRQHPSPRYRGALKFRVIPIKDPSP